MTRYCVFNTSKGYIAALEKDGYIMEISLPKPNKNSALKNISYLSDAICVEPAVFGKLPDLLIGYFQGNNVDFSNIKINLDGFSVFRMKVIDFVRGVPYGTVISYSDVAKRAGFPGAARAVGKVMAKNRTPIIVPCHRVVAASGLGGFSSGLDMKRDLLNLEGVELE